MDVIEEFVDSFHQLEGVTIGERQKNLSLLLNTFKKLNLNKDDCARLDDLLQPRDKLEESFKLIVFIGLKDTSYLFDIFNNENIDLVGMLVKQIWFFDKPFHDISAEFLLNSIFSKTSFVVRQKIINKLSCCLQKENVAEEFFNAILNKFGLREAVKLLPACSSVFVINVVQNYNVRFKDKQLLHIVKKDHKFVEAYFKECAKYIKNKSFVNDFKLVLRYLAANDFALFLALFDEYRVLIKMNKSLTEKVYNFKKDDILARPLYYMSSLNVNKVLFLLRDDFEQFYTNSFPKKATEFFYAFQSSGGKKYSEAGRLQLFIQHLSPGEMYEVVSKTFLKVYNVEITSYPRFITEELVRIMPQPEKEKWIKIISHDDKWICYFETQKSIPLIKEKIKLYSDVNNRSRYLNYLIETCRINNDKVALIDVLKYFADRHRNEDVFPRTSFLQTLYTDFNLEKLLPEHWAEINNILNVFKLNNEYLYNMEAYLRTYLGFLFLRNESIDEEVLLEILKNRVKMSTDFTIFTENLQLEKEVILKCADMVLRAFDESEKLDACIGFLTTLKDWNRRHRRYAINPFSYQEIINTMLKEEKNRYRNHYPYSVLLHYLITLKGDWEVKELLYQKFWDDCKGSYYGKVGTSIFLTLLKIDPQEIVKRAEDVANLKHRMDQFWKASKFYSHLQIPEFFHKRSLENFQDEGNDDRPRYASMLSHFMPTAVFIEYMVPFYPTESKILYEDKVKYQIQRSIMQSFKNLDRISLAISTIQKFCIGDYLQTVLGSVYYAVYYTPEYKLNEFIEVLMGRAVSVRKHALFLIVNTSDSQRIYNALKYAGANEKNGSLCKFILKRTLKYFCQNPSSQFWELLRINAKIIRKDDEEAYQYFLNLEEVPLQYLARFIQFAWDTIEESTLDKIKKEKYGLLRSVTDENICLLPEMFCQKILSQDLFVNDANADTINNFCCLYLSASSDGARLEFVFALLKDHIAKRWNDSCNNMYRRTVLNFLMLVCKNAVLEERSGFLDEFAAWWYKTVDVIEAFEEHLILKCSLLYLDTDCDNKISNYAKKISDLYNNTLSTHGVGITRVFAIILNNRIFTYMSGLDGTFEEHKFDFFEQLNNANKCASTYTLILNMLPKKYSLSQDIVLRHKTLLKEIDKCEDSLVKIFYYIYIKGLYDE